MHVIQSAPCPESCYLGHHCAYAMTLPLHISSIAVRVRRLMPPSPPCAPTNAFSPMPLAPAGHGVCGGEAHAALRVMSWAMATGAPRTRPRGQLTLGCPLLVMRRTLLGRALVGTLGYLRGYRPARW